MPQDGPLPATVSTELTRLNPFSVNIAGGTSAISSLVEGELAGFGAGTVVRSAGQDRYETAAALAGITNGGLGKTASATSFNTYPMGATTGYLASAAAYPDALAGAPVAPKAP